MGCNRDSIFTKSWNELPKPRRFFPSMYLVFFSNVDPFHNSCLSTFGIIYLAKWAVCLFCNRFGDNVKYCWISSEIQRELKAGRKGKVSAIMISSFSCSLSLGSNYPLLVCCGLQICGCSSFFIPAFLDFSSFFLFSSAISQFLLQKRLCNIWTKFVKSERGREGEVIEWTGMWKELQTDRD